jgi:carbonic anhydrase/acetyltransferase-like protein (isoleucine patch superfamily)
MRLLPSCEASAASLHDVVVGADVFIGAAAAVMDCVAAEVLNASYIVPSVLRPRARVVAHTITTAATTADQHPYSERNR